MWLSKIIQQIPYHVPRISSILGQDVRQNFAHATRGKPRVTPAELSGYQRKYLRGLAHTLKPVVTVGKAGISIPLLEEVEQALSDHELIKIRFANFKDEKKQLSHDIVRETRGHLAGMIGHVAIFYRPRQDPEKQTIHLPE